MTQVLWSPSPQQIADAQVTKFCAFVNKRFTLDLKDSRALYQWSIDNIPEFWDSFWDFCGVKGIKGSAKLKNSTAMPGAQFFPEAQLNYAENLLNHGRNPEEVAIHFRGEDKVKRQVTFRELENQVSSLQQFFKHAHVNVGDRVASILPNMPETVIAMLAATSLGATWSSASPDFGVQGILDRFSQIEPKILLVPDGYYYNGKWIDCRPKWQEIIPRIPSLEAVIIVSYHPDTNIDPIDGSNVWSHILDIYKPQPITFTPVTFNHPLFIMFSSGTTGKPKCIVHSTGGPLLQLLKEHRLHCDIRKGDKVFYFTTCGWMMWNWQINALASGATLCQFDGSPFAPDGNVLFDYADDVGVTLFGIGAKYIDSLKKQNMSPKDTHELDTVRTMTSTGSVLVPEAFEYIYKHIKSDLHLASISGGTDIVSCFMLGDPTRPVYIGELQTAGFGLAVDVYTQEGKPAPVGEKGELVCTKPFPCMPVSFWNDPDGAKYKKAYFERFPGVWHHGDYVEKTAHGGFIIHGRSDATLKPSGVRIGTAEIYAQVEHLPEVVECVAVGQKWNDDERVILFVILKPGLKLDDELIAKIKKQVRTGASPHHVPSKILQVADIPRTKNNKISEIAVRDTINGIAVANTEALANPEVLKLYQDLPELKQA